MNARRTHYLLLGLVALLIIGLVGGAYLLNSLLGKQAVQLANLKATAQTLNDQQSGLKKAKQDIATYSDLEKITKQIVPQDKDQAEAVREIVNIAGTAGVTLSSIAFPASNLGAATPSASAPASGSSSTTTTSPSAALNAKPTLSQLTPVPSITGVYQLPITLQNDQSTAVSYPKFEDFLSRLENNRRTAQVTSIVIQPTTANRNLLTFTLTINEYIKP